MPTFTPDRRPAAPGIWLCTLLSFAGLLLWDAAGVDLPMARWFGAARGFALESHWLWRDVLHDDVRLWPWVVELGLLLVVLLPVGIFKRLPLARRAQLALTTMAAVAAVSSIKLHSHTSCPWDLQEFGGTARYVSHWAWGVLDGGTGNCFPAGHASAGFAFVGGFFAFRHGSPALAWRWLVAVLVLGLIFGVAQQVRGAHYTSHTLWTAWLCWTVAAVVDAGFSRLLAQRLLPAPARVRDFS